MDGIINVYKEKGFTSFDVVAKMRGILKTKKIGHTGTLDPDAEGVLPVCIGSATKLCDMLTDKSKEYTAVMRLGITTDTQDMTGKVLTVREVPADEAQIRQTADSFIGEYDQTPPMYSALKVGGQKLCDLARQGKVVERAARRVTIHALKITEAALPLVTMHVHCSKGTYIRTLCQDIGEKLGCGGCMQSLVRTRVAEFTLDGAKTLAQIEQFRDAGRLGELILPVESVFSKLAPMQVKKEAQRLLDNGNPVRMEQTEYRAWSKGNVERMARRELTGGVELTDGVKLTDSVELTDGVELTDSVKLTDNVELTDGMKLTDSVELTDGVKLTDGMQVRMYHSDGRFCGIYAYSGQNHLLKPVKIFCL